MIGTGVFVSAGFMAQDLGPGVILAAWAIGALLAALGVAAYAELARLIPRSGGEYRFVSELLHPIVGILAGWSSLLFGFSAPIPINALGAAAFVDALGPIGDPRWVAAAFVIIPTLSHAVRNDTSRWVQNSLAAIKIGLVVAFAIFGLSVGETSWPTWAPPKTDGFALPAFMTGLFFVGFAFTGWNSSVYAASEFREPARDVPRSMLIGLGLVTVLYLVVNWVFVANLDPATASAVMTDDSAVTLGHLVASRLIGKAGATIMSVVIIMAFLSAISAIIVIGPRVYAEMAEDGFLPRALRYDKDRTRPPTVAVLFQGAVATALLVSHSLREVLINASAILLLFSALAAIGLIRLALSAQLRQRLGSPSRWSVLAAVAFTAFSGWMLAFGFRHQPSMLLWLGGAALLTAVSYAALRRS